MLKARAQRQAVNGAGAVDGASEYWTNMQVRLCSLIHAAVGALGVLLQLVVERLGIGGFFQDELVRRAVGATGRFRSGGPGRNGGRSRL